MLTPITDSTPCRTARRTRQTVAALLVAAAASAASAVPVDVCNPALPYTMPDHDQVRWSLFSVVGLQGNGTQYCVPTCTTDILTYLQNHGYPNLGMGPGPGPWLGNQNIYNAFSTDIEALASLMNTDPAGGTGGNNAFAGVNDWIDNAGYTGDIVVSMFGMSDDSAPELGDIAFSLIARCPISISVGWYENQGNNNYVRRGGHCVAVTRIPDFCSPFPKLSIRDPGTSIGSNQFTQAVGTTETYSLTPNLFINRRDADDNSLVYSGPAVRIAGYGAANRTAIIDGYRAFFPAFGLSACNNPVNGSCVTQHMPNSVFTGLPSSIPLSLPGDSTVFDLAIRSDNLASWIIAQVPTPAGPKIKTFLCPTGEAAAREETFPSMAPFNPRRVVSGREPRVLYFLDNNPHLVVRLNTATGAATPMSVANAATAIAFDDQQNELVLFSSAARTITRLDADTLAPVSTRSLPTSVIVGPEPRIAVCPVGGYVWLTSGVNIGYGFLPGSRGDDLLIGGTISHDEPLRGVDTNDAGHVFTTAAGETIEYLDHSVTVLAWTRVDGVSPLAGLADGPIFKIAKSRTNYNRAIHSKPEETTNILPEIVAPSVPDCPADFNLSGNVSVQDIFDFLAAYFANQPAGDFNGSGGATVQDIFDFLAAYFAGCP